MIRGRNGVNRVNRVMVGEKLVMDLMSTDKLNRGDHSPPMKYTVAMGYGLYRNLE